jgi:hypothetical protein
LLIPDKFDTVDQFNEGLARVNIGTKSAYIEKTGKYVWGPKE